MDERDPVAHGGDGDDTFEVDGDVLAEGADTQANNNPMGLFGNMFAREDGGNLDIDGGEGVDTLLVTGDVKIDMGALDDNISNIEQIDLGSGEQNIISLSVSDVLEITDDNNMLRIDGDSSDSIELNSEGEDAEWKLGDFKTDAETGSTYQEVIGMEDDVTVGLEINTDIDISES